MAQASGAILVSPCASSAASAMDKKELLELLYIVHCALAQQYEVLVTCILLLPDTFFQGNMGAEESALDVLYALYKKIGLAGFRKMPLAGTDIYITFTQFKYEYSAVTKKLIILYKL